MASRIVSRRHVLAGVGGGLAGLAVFGFLPALERLAAGAVSAVELKQLAFTRLVGSAFRVELAGSRTRVLELISVRPLQVRGPRPVGEGFSLLFSGSRSGAFGQDIYTVNHPRLGRFGIFLAPVGPPGPDQRYEAVFNRLWK